MNDNNQRTMPRPRATTNRAHCHITLGLKLNLQPLEHIESEIGLPHLDVLSDIAAPQPQASLLPQPQGISSLLYTFLLSYFPLSLSLFYLKTKSMKVK